MTVKRVSTPREYTGLVADAMPATDPDDGQDVPVGSIFHERDSGFTYIYDGVAWGKIIYPTSV